jgi:thymidine phosphorylase
MLPQELIRAKRDGRALSADDIAAFVRGMVNGAVTEGQAAAFAMAVYFRGMSTDEAVALTTAMRDSGAVLHWSLDGPVLDKHSTGGVGDTVSLMLAPMVAACGGYVPMISGRGLGHTGGTFDKMESIPGYNATPTMAKFRSVVGWVGCAVIGQTADLAPADKRLYGIRDVTATVESVPLITASILSKKLAAGLQGLAMDVKTGSGAFMPTLARSRELAHSIAGVANGAGVATVALVTDMDRPLGDTAGNALEVAYAIDFLTGTRREPRMLEIVLALGAEMLVLGGLDRTTESARKRLQASLDSGAAAETFARMVSSLGGPKRLLDDPWQHLERAPVELTVHAPRPGTVRRIDTRSVGMAVVALGGGRTRPQDPVDHSVGVTRLAGLGDHVGPDAPLAVVHARSDQQAEQAARMLREAYSLAGRSATAHPVVIDRITS